MRRIDNSSSQDGIETTSITSSVENEIRRPSKTKRSSIKRKTNFKDDSDDTVNQPLLQSENDISEFKQSAKFVSSKSKTDPTNERSDNTNIITKVKKTSPTTSTFSENITIKGVTADIESASTSVTAPIHNYMNTNIFGVIDTTTSKSTKSTLIVEIENTKSSYSPSPLIFTTAKIHTDNKTREMEPLHVTPVPILSTIEGNVIKSIPSTIDSSEKQYDTVKSKSESQKKCIQENEQSIITNASTLKEHSITVSPNIKTTVVSSDTTIPVSGQSTKQTSFDKPLIVQTDFKIPVTSSKVEKINSTSTNIKLQDEKTRTAVDMTKKNLPEKYSAERSKFEIQEKPSKKQEKQSFLMDESQKQTSNGVTPQIQCLSANKAAILTSSNYENTSDKEKDSKSGSSFPTNKQLQRQKKTVEDTCISDAKNQTIVCDPKVNIFNDGSRSILETKAKSGIIEPTMPKLSLDSQNILTILPTKSGASTSVNYSAVSDKPIFVSSMPKETANTTDKIDPVTSVLLEKGKKVDKTGSLISKPMEKKNILDKSSSSTSVPKGKATTTSDKSLTPLTAVKANSTDKSKTMNKTSPLTSVPSGKVINIDKSGSLNSTAAGKANIADKHISASSLPVVKTNTIDKPSSLSSAPMTTAKIPNKPDSLSFIPAVSPNTTIKPGPVASATSVKAKPKEKSPLISASKGSANITAKPGSLSTDKANTAGKISSVKSAPSEQTITVTTGSKTPATVTKISSNDKVATTSGPILSKSTYNGKSSGKESVAEVKKVSEKPKSKISPTLKSELSIAPSDSKPHKGVPTSATTNVSTNVVTTIAKKLGNETNVTTSSTATSSIKGSAVSSLSSSSTSAKTLIGTNKNNESMSSENNKDSRA